MAKRRMGLIVFLLCFCVCLLPCRVLAASTADAKEPISAEQGCSLTIDYGKENVSVTLYKIADVSADYQYTLTPSFGESNLVLNGIQTVGEWNVIRSTLETYILANGIEADAHTATDAEGSVSFDALNTGLYLAMADPVIQDETTYVFDSALLALPSLSANGVWQYQVAAKAKCTLLPPIDSDEETEFKVTKLWKGDTEKSGRPKTIEVEIFRNGASHETVILSEKNHWTYRWSAKDDGSDWKVIERNVPAGYTMTMEERGTSFVLVNTLKHGDTEEPDSPYTGDRSNTMLWFILMIISGSMLIILGTIGKRSRTR